MTKKVTENDLNKLIEQVLKEEQRLDEKSFGKYKGDKVADRKSNIGYKGQNPSDAKFKELVSLDTTPEDTLDLDDLLKAKKKGGDVYKTAQTWYKKSSKTRNDRGASPKLDDFVTHIAGETPFTSKLSSTSLPTGVTPDPYAFGQMPKVYDDDKTKSTASATNWKKWNSVKQGLKLDPLLSSLFLDIDGKTALEKWNSIMQFATEARKGKDGLEGWVKTSGSNNEFKLMNYSLVLALLADAPKMGDSSNSGDFFEGFLAYLFQAPITGGTGRAIDNIAKMGDSSLLYMSAKYYTNLSQATQAQKNLEQDTEEFGKIYYMTIVKVAEGGGSKSGAKFDSLYLYLTEIFRGSGKTIYGRSIDSSGTATGKAYKITNGKLYPTKNGHDPALTIPVLPVGASEKDLSRVTANFLSTELQKTNKKRAKGIASSLKELAAMDQKLKAYSGKKSKSDASSKQGATDFMKEIYSSLVSTSDSYKGVFAGETGEQFSSVKTPAALEEQKITADLLKKLISESFKR